MFKSYKKKIGGLKQQQVFNTFKSSISPYQTYEIAWSEMKDIYQFGRFSMFLYLEAVHVVTGFNMKPKSMDISDADSCRNGLAYAIGEERYLTGKNETLVKEGFKYMQKKFDLLVSEMEKDDPQNNVWNIETTLCAYKKYRLGDRWVGYYLDRQANEIRCMQSKVVSGVDWSVLWDYRTETFQKEYLQEYR